MAIFDLYARYYDLLYRDKDYTGEAEYIHSLIQKHRPGAKKILELGSGTGKHACLLAAKGYEIHGVERSEEMLARAQALAKDNPRVEFTQGDIRDVRIPGKRFDVVISLFHVFSYQTSNADLEAAFATAREHLADDGVLIFDTWYGPAVLTDRPAVRVKRIEDETIQVTRLAEPALYPATNTVDVNYQVFIREKGKETVHETRETHRMRYLFTPEVEYFMQKTGFEMARSEEWMTGREPSFETWGVCFVAKGRGA